MSTLDPRLKVKLEALEERSKELAALLAEPDVTQDMERYRTLTRSYAELTAVVEKFSAFRAKTTDLDDAKQVLRLLAGKIDFLCFGHDHDSEVYCDRHAIDWMLASGKSTSKSRKYKFQYREVVVDGDSNSVSMVTFKPPK